MHILGSPISGPFRPASSSFTETNSAIQISSIYEWAPHYNRYVSEPKRKAAFCHDIGSHFSDTSKQFAFYRRLQPEDLYDLKARPRFLQNCNESFFLQNRVKLALNSCSSFCVFCQARIISL